MAEYQKVIDDLNIGMANTLRTNMKKEQLIDLLVTLLHKHNIDDITSILCSTQRFPSEELLNIIMKKDKKLFYTIMDEPESENEMQMRVAKLVSDEGYRTAFEVLTPKEGKAKGRRMDVAGVKAPTGWGGRIKDVEIIGYELKCEASRGAIDKAFAQAKDYQKYCEYTIVGISPVIYAKHYDTILQKMRDYKDIGVQVIGKSLSNYELTPAKYTYVNDKLQMEMMENIHAGKGN